MQFNASTKANKTKVGLDCLVFRIALYLDGPRANACFVELKAP